MGTNGRKKIPDHQVYAVKTGDVTKLIRVETKAFKAWLDKNHAGNVNAESLRSYVAHLHPGIQQGRFVKLEYLGPKKVVLPPGYSLAKIASFLLTRGAYKRYVQPAIADMQQEYIDALAAGYVRHARWIAVRGHLLVFPNWLYGLVAGKLAALLRRGS